MSGFQKDLLERVTRTFVQAALAVVAANLAGLVDLDGVKTVAVSAFAAGLSAVMSLVATHVGDPQTASFAKNDPTHDVPDDLVELHQLNELNGDV